MTVYLCTTGTSAARLIPRQEGFGEAWVTRQGGIEPAAGRLLESFGEYPPTDAQALHSKLSAEIHSLAKMPLESIDRVYLYCSQTLDGQACARAVALYLQQYWPGVITEVSVVNGLQVKDEAQFRTAGVVDFIRQALRVIDSYGPGQCVLNPTGGFKALVPYTALIGMLKQVPSRYIFEQPSALLTLPPFPIEFARNLINPFLDTLERINEESAISLAEWKQAVAYDQRSLLEPLVEIERDQVTLSAIGLLVRDEIRSPSALIPYISQKVLHNVVKKHQLANCNPLQYLERVARDPGRFEQDKHASIGQGFTWLKPGNTADRYLVTREPGRLLVWEALNHNDYDRWDRKPNALIAERANQYAPFVRLDWVY